MISIIRNIIFIPVITIFLLELLFVLTLICLLLKFEITVLLCDCIKVLTLLMQLWEILTVILLKILL